MLSTQQNPILNSEKSSLTINGQSSTLKKTSKKTKNKESDTFKKGSKSIISFFKLTNSKNQRKLTTQPEKYDNLPQEGTKEQQKIKKSLQTFAQTSSPNFNTEIGSQYGDYNYDQQLHLVLKKGKKSTRQQLISQKVNFRTQACQDEHKLGKNYKRFQKFQTEIHQLRQDNYSPSKQSRIYDRETQKGNPNYFSKENSQRNPKYNIKQLLKLYQGNTSTAQQTTEQKPFGQQSMFGNFLQIGLKKVQGITRKANTTPHQIQTHRRSKTEHDSCTPDKQKSDQIFQNYKKLKENSRKISSTYRQKFSKQKQWVPVKENLTSKQQEIHATGLMRKIYNSTPKYEVPTVLQNIFTPGIPTARMCLTPKGISTMNTNEEGLKKLIKARQRDFFQPIFTSKLQSPLFSFEQIKSKLAKIEQLQSKKRHNKSLTILNDKSLLSKDILFYVKNQKEEDRSKKDQGIKFKGISFKANLIKKHADFYQNQMKKRTELISQKITPKVSKLHL